jgi:hypothetical protein
VTDDERCRAIRLELELYAQRVRESKRILRQLDTLIATASCAQWALVNREFVALLYRLQSRKWGRA